MATATRVGPPVLVAIGSWALAAWGKDRRKFHGRWEATIQWEPSWGDKLLGGTSTNPRSVGDLCLSYGAGLGGSEYWGLSIWTLLDGDERYSELCVELKDIEVGHSVFQWEWPWIGGCRLARLRLAARIRRKIKADFEYPKFAEYDVEFKETRVNRLSAHVKVNESGKVRKVGSLIATRVAG